MRVMITAAKGQLGKALMASPPAGIEAVGFTRPVLDLTKPETMRECAQAVEPDLIINTGAYTAVDAAESNENEAYQLNRDAVTELARLATIYKAQLVHISTDFVFDGTASSPYPVDAPSSPLGVYAASKRAGEEAAGKDALIIRTAWVYASEGANFAHTMLRMMRERGAVNVVADQVGTPTWASSLAEAIWSLAAKDARGIYHYTDSGVASWYDFAVAIAEEAVALGLLETMPEVTPVTTADFPTPAKRPAYSVLDKSKTNALIGPAPHWRVNLRKMLQEVAANG